MRLWIIVAAGVVIAIGAWLVAQRMYQTLGLLVVALVAAGLFLLVAPRRPGAR
ncbi:MAG: hypothetical protein ACR2KI_01955 [Candidatus Limnocylindria bacterium]